MIVNLRPDTDPETAFVMSSLADQRNPLRMIQSMTRLPLVNNVRFCGNSSGCCLMKPAKLGDRSTLSTKLDGLAPLTVPLLLKPQVGAGASGAAFQAVASHADIVRARVP